MRLLDIFLESEQQETNPALLTLSEYYKLVNAKDKHHEDHAYQTDLKKMNNPEYPDGKEKYPKLLKQTKINNINFQFRLLEDKWGYTIAVFDEENQKVASAQDEWGCMLYMVAREYRGFGLGAMLAKMARTLEPGKASGGFTPSGYRTFVKVHREFVRDALTNGLYGRLVRSGEMSTARVKEIVDSAKLDIKQTKPTENYNSNDPKDWMLYVDNGAFVLYDKKLKEVYKNTGDEVEDYWIEKMIKGVMLVRDFHDNGIVVQFGGDSEKIKRMMITCAITFCANEKIPFLIDPEDRQYVDPRYGKVSEEPTYKIAHKRYLVTPLDTIELDAFQKVEKHFRKSFDQYDEFYHRMLELGFRKFRYSDG